MSISSSLSSLRVTVFLKNSPRTGSWLSKGIRSTCRAVVLLYRPPMTSVSPSAICSVEVARRTVSPGTRKAADLNPRAVVQVADFRRHRHLNRAIADQRRRNQITARHRVYTLMVMEELTPPVPLLLCATGMGISPPTRMLPSLPSSTIRLGSLKMRALFSEINMFN